MEFFRKIFIGSFVILLSAAIFYFLINDENMKDDILRTTLETLGKEVLAMVPDGESKTALHQQFNKFMNRVSNNELSKEQIQTTAASILNLKMEPDQATPQVIEAVLEAHIDSTVMPSPRGDYKADASLNRRELASQIKEMMSLQEEIERLSAEDSIAREIRNNVVFSADSGLQVWVSPEVMEEHIFTHNPEFQNRLEKLKRQKIVRYYNFEQINELGIAGLKFAAPFLSPGDRDAIKAYLIENAPPADSLSFERILPHPDSIVAWIRVLNSAEKQIKEMEKWNSVKD